MAARVQRWSGLVVRQPTGSWGRRTRAGCLLALVLLAAVLCAASAGTGGARADTTQPNIVFILTDDQRFDELNHMPTVMADIADQGVTFTNAFVPDPLCCPS